MEHFLDYCHKEIMEMNACNLPSLTSINAEGRYLLTNGKIKFFRVGEGGKGKIEKYNSLFSMNVVEKQY